MDKIDGYLIIAFIIFLLYYMTNIVIYIVLVVIVLLLVYKYRKKFIPKIEEIIKEETPHNNDVHYNNNITEPLDNLKKYRKYNINDYNSGLRYFHKFMDTIHKLENRHIKHTRQYIENAKLYLNKSINHFQYITTSISDRTLLDGLKYDDYTSTKKAKKLHKIIDELYKVSYHILHTITFDRNKKFMDKPNNHDSQIDLDVPEPSNSVKGYDLY